MTANCLRFGVVAVLGRVINVIGIVFIMAATATAGYLLLRAMHSDVSPVFPLIVYAVMGYMVGHLFMNVFGLAVDTSLQCVIFAEEKCPEGNFVPPQLKRVIDRSSLCKDDNTK